MLLVIVGEQAWRGFLNFSTCRSNDAVGGLRSANLASFFNFGTSRSNGNLQMRRVRVAVISIGTMVSCE